MNPNERSIEKLEKQLRVLERKLERSEWHRVDLENQHDRDQHLYRRLQSDLEAAQREAQIQLALERIRTQSSLMEHSSELVATSAVFHEQLLALGVDTEFSYVWLPEEREEKHQFWATWTEEEGGAPVHRSRAITYDLDKSEPYTAACFAAWESDDPIHVDFIPPDDVAHFFATWEELLRGAEHLKPEHFPDGLYYAEGYMQYGCFGINIRREPTEEERDVLRRFAVEFERAYTRFLDLRRAEAQAREAEIEASLERVRSRTMAMHDSDELAETASVMFRELEALEMLPPDTRTYITIVDRETDTAEAWMTRPDGTVRPGSHSVPLTEHPSMASFYEAWKRGGVAFVRDYSGVALDSYLGFVLSLPHTADDEGYQRLAASPPERIVMTDASFSQGTLGVMSAELLTPGAQVMLQRFAKVFEQTYTRFLDLKQAEAQAREASISASLERVRAQAMAMHRSEDLARPVGTVFEELDRLGLAIGRCGIMIVDGEARRSKVWTTAPTDEGGVAHVSGEEELMSHPLLAAIYHGWAAQEDVDYVLEGEDRRAYYDFEDDATVQLPEGSVPTSGTLREYFYCATFPAGILYAFHEAPISGEVRRVMRRFADAFYLAYARFLDLKQAEAQAREAEIEAALERVRSRAVAMRSSDELGALSFELVKQVQALGVETWHCAFHIYDEDEERSTEWGANADGYYPTYTIPRVGIFRRYYEIGQSGADLHVEVIGEDRAAEHYEALCAVPGVGEVLLRLKESGVPFPERQVDHVAYFKYGYLIFITFEPAPDAHDVFRRFARVFEQAYTRFLDLQAAEEQAREAEVEAALERLRARTMAMQSSDDLSDVIGRIFGELTRLDLDLTRCVIWVIDPETRDAHFWMANAERSDEPDRYHIPYHDHPSYLAFLDAWDRQEDLWTYDLYGDLKTTWDEVLFTETELARLPAEVKAGMAAPDRVRLTASFTSFGALHAASLEPLSAESTAILRRVARVFDQTYTRFLDIQKAEEQAKENRIQLSLERVRASAMAMHNSEDLSSTIRIFYNEFVGLCQSAIIRCGSGVIRGTTTVADLASWSRSPEGELVEVRGPIDMMGHPLLKGVYSHWEMQKEYVHVLEGNEIKKYYSSLKKQLSIPDYPAEARQYSYFHMFPEGSFYVFTEEPLLDEELRSFRRFSSVLSLTYRRYHDLEQAEARAREAQIEAALEKVRSRTMAMHKPEELQEVVTLVAEKLLDLGVVMDAGGVIICTYFQNSKDVMHWLASSDFSSSKPYLLPYFDHPIFNAAWASRESGDEFFSEAFPVEDKNSFFRYAFEHSDYRHFPKEFQEWVMAAEHHALTFAWAANSAILIPSFTDISPSESDKEILKRFANVFEQAYIRFLDLKKAEEQAREAQVEAALERVRSRALEMASSEELLDVVFKIRQEFAGLGLECGAFWHTRYTPESYHKALTGIDGQKLAAVMELPRDFASNPALEAWERGDEKIGVFAFDTEAACEYHHHMVTKGKFFDVDPEAITEEMIREHGGWTFVQARTSHGEIGYSLWGETEPSEEAKDVLVRFTSTFDLAYRRFLDLQQAEADHQALLEEKALTEQALEELRATQQQLVHAEKMASLGALTAGIAHEIKNPLNFVTNFASLSQELVAELEDEADPDERHALLADLKQNAAKIEEHGRRADAIVRSMMQHARGGSGERQSVDLNALVEEYVELAYHGRRATTPEFHVAIERDYGEGVGQVEVVPSDLGRVLLNLVSNAFDAVAEHAAQAEGRVEPRVQVSTAMDGEQAVICVCDNGPGIPPPVRDKIFEPFFTTKPAGAGTGLGLSMSYDIVTQGHGGTLAVESTPGDGARFVIRLPLSGVRAA